MKKIQKTAKALDMVFKILEIIIMIAFVSLLVGLGIIIIGTLLNLPSNQIGTEFNKFDIQNLTLVVAEKFAPDVNSVLLFTSIFFTLAAAVAIIGKKFIVLIRKVLKTVIEGLPFDNSVADNLKRSSLMVILIGVGLNIVNVVEHIFAVYIYDLPSIILSDKITQATLTCKFDFGFLITATVIYLISLVCRYGATLQQQVDETL